MYRCTVSPYEGNTSCYSKSRRAHIGSLAEGGPRGGVCMGLCAGWRGPGGRCGRPAKSDAAVLLVGGAGSACVCSEPAPGSYCYGRRCVRKMACAVTPMRVELPGRGRGKPLRPHSCAGPVGAVRACAATSAAALHADVHCGIQLSHARIRGRSGVEAARN